MSSRVGLAGSRLCMMSPANRGPVFLGIAILMAAAFAAAQADAEPRRRSVSIPIAVYGDSMATQVYHGLRWAVRGTPDIHIRSRSRGGTGLVRDDQYDWFGQLRIHLERDDPRFVVVSLGGNDRQDFRSAGGLIPRFSEEWWLRYRTRVDHTMALLKSRPRRVYWLTLPAVRSAEMTADYEKINAMLAELAARHDVQLVDSRHRFANAAGDYISVGRDIRGRLRQLRHRDGIHFSQHGQRILAVAVLRAFRDDVATK